MSTVNENRPKENGWQQLKRENEAKFKENFSPIQSFIRRNEYLGSLIELFMSALVGVGKLNLGFTEDNAKNIGEDNTTTNQSEEES